MALPTSLRLWNTSVLSSAYSMMSFSWWWKNSRMPGGGRRTVSGRLKQLSRVNGKLSGSPTPDSGTAKSQLKAQAEY